MTTCEHCGADAVGVDDICRACGWRAARSEVVEPDDAPSLAETRAADLPVPARSPLLSRVQAPPAFGARDVRGAHTPSGGSSTHAGAGPLPGGQTSRFCGTCGARIEVGQQFCGQCGSAVLAGSDIGEGTALQRAVYPPSPRRAMSSPNAWDSVDHDAPTETFMDYPDQGMNSYPQQFGFGRSAVGQAGGAVRDQSSDVRIIIGILCVLGGLISGAGALILALPHP
jgi:hypothetical protein